MGDLAMESKLGMGIEGGAPGDARFTLDPTTFHGFGVSHVPKCLKLRRPENLHGHGLGKEVGAEDQASTPILPVGILSYRNVFPQDGQPRRRNVREITFL